MGFLYHCCTFGGAYQNLMFSVTVIWLNKHKLLGKKEEWLVYWLWKTVACMTKSPESFLPLSVLWQIHLWTSLCAWTAQIQVYWSVWSLRDMASVDCLLKLQLDHEHRSAVQFWQPPCTEALILCFPSDSWHGLLHDTLPADSQDWQKIRCLKPLKHYHINPSDSS